MQTIRSTDGTPIAYQRSGQGSPLILVHGTTADHTRHPFFPILSSTSLSMQSIGEDEGEVGILSSIRSSGSSKTLLPWSTR